MGKKSKKKRKQRSGPNRYAVHRARVAGSIWHQAARDNFSGPAFATMTTPCALVQCWRCNLDEGRKVGVGRLEELRCRRCKGAVEVLQVWDDANATTEDFAYVKRSARVVSQPGHILIDFNKIIKETDKALLVRFNGRQDWVPKTQIADARDYREGDVDGMISLTEWIANEKGLS